MTNALSIIENGTSIVIDKRGNTGSFALAIAYASREQRAEFGQMMYAKWLGTGQFRPLVNDILASGLIPKAAVPYVAATVPATGAISKDTLTYLCQQISGAVAAKGKELKGKKAYVFAVVDRIARGATPSTIEA